MKRKCLYLRMSLVAGSSAELSHLGRSVESLGLDGGGHEITGSAGLEHLTHLLHAHAGHTLHVLRRQLSFAVLFALSQSHVERFRHQNPPVHLSHRLGRLFR